MRKILEYLALDDLQFSVAKDRGLSNLINYLSQNI